MDRQKGTRAGKIEDRKEERERGKKEQRKNATCGEGNNNCYTPLTEGGEEQKSTTHRRLYLTVNTTLVSIIKTNQLPLFRKTRTIYC